MKVYRKEGRIYRKDKSTIILGFSAAAKKKYLVILPVPPGCVQISPPRIMLERGPRTYISTLNGDFWPKLLSNRFVHSNFNSSYI